MIGFPEETTAELSSSIAMAARLKLMGVETVQLHRLRVFPPSSLSRNLPASEFDLDSLRIEYPFLDISTEDIEAIKRDRSFFSGYWAPLSSAGTPAQLAQVEMFFHHTIALAPMTVAAAAQFAAGRLIPAFYDCLGHAGPIRREQLDWESGALFRNWCELEPLMTAWLMPSLSLKDWQLSVVKALLEYEGHRIRFVTSQSPVQPMAIGRSWTAFTRILTCPRHSKESRRIGD